MNFVFDLYGTLIDIKTDESTPEFWQGVCALFGDSDPDKTKDEYIELCRQANKGEYHEIDLLGVFEQMLKNRGRSVAEATDVASEFRRLSMVKLCLFPCAKAILTGLKARGCGVYLVSNAQSCFTVNELNACGLTELFDGIILSSDLGVKKPSPEIFEYAFKKFGISAENSLYVGNDLHDDVMGADGVGMKTAYIRTEQSGGYDMPMPTPTYTAKSHLGLLKKLFSVAKER